MTDRSAFIDSIRNGEESKRNAIREMKDILENISIVKNELRRLEPRTIKLKKKYIWIKTTGTVMNAIGALAALIVCAVAYFTGDGESAYWKVVTDMSIATSVIGTSLNVMADYTNRSATENYLKEITQITSRLQRVFEDLDNALKHHEKEVCWIKEKYRLNESAPIYYARNGYSAISNIIAIIDTTGRGVVKFQAAHQLKKLKKTNWKKADELISTSDIANSATHKPLKPPTTAGVKTYRGTLIIAFNIAIVTWEISSLVTDWKENHPTTQAIKAFYDEVDYVEKIITSLLDKYDN